MRGSRRVDQASLFDEFSLDPELLLRMLTAGYCFGIRSEQRLCDEVHHDPGLPLGCASEKPVSMTRRNAAKGLKLMVPRDGVEPPTLRFSVACSTN